uniref:Uncharacterized protein n=1 Tax=Arundo donax TaxID=35708 RepID=A0A0A9FGC9_ARUDO
MWKCYYLLGDQKTIHQ